MSLTSQPHLNIQNIKSQDFTWCLEMASLYMSAAISRDHTARHKQAFLSQCRQFAVTLDSYIFSVHPSLAMFQPAFRLQTFTTYSTLQLSGKTKHWQQRSWWFWKLIIYPDDSPRPSSTRICNSTRCDERWTILLSFFIIKLWNDPGYYHILSPQCIHVVALCKWKHSKYSIQYYSARFIGILVKEK